MDIFAFCDQTAADLLRSRNVDEVLAINDAVRKQLDDNRAVLREIVQSDYCDILGIHNLLENIDKAADHICTNINSIQKKSLSDYSQKITDLVNDYECNLSLSSEASYLLLAPERIWQFLDEDQFIPAVHLLKIVENLSKSTQNDIIKNSALKVQYFHSKIIQNIQLKLTSDYIDTENLMNYLTPYLLLISEHNKNDVCSNLINIRQKSILDLFSSNRFYNDISHMFNNITTTFQLLFYIFNNFETDLNISNEIYLTCDDEPIKVPTFPKINLQFQLSDLKRFQDYLKFLEEKLSVNFQKYLQEHINCIKALYEISHKYQLIKRPHNWSEICMFFHLKNDFIIWYDLPIKSLITNRLKEIIEQRVQNCFDTIQKRILNTETNSDYSETDLSEYLWNYDEEFDVQSLQMKTKGYSVTVVELCNFLDSEVKCLLKDLKTYSIDLNEKYENEFLKDTCTTSLKSFIVYWTEYNLQDLAVILLSCRFLDALLLLCPNLVKCFRRTKINEFLLNAKEDLWLKWLDFVLKRFQNIIATQFQILGTDQSFFSDWKKIEIEEELNNVKFKSEISVPQETTSELQTVLSEACSELNRVLIHTIPRTIHKQFIEQIFCQILTQYQQLLKTINNNVDLLSKNAIQFYFDVKFLTSFCFVNKDLLESAREISNDYEKKIDPFDFKVFYPHLKENIRIAVLQSKPFYGSLLTNYDSFGTEDDHSLFNLPPDDKTTLVTTQAQTTVHYFNLLN